MTTVVVMMIADRNNPHATVARVMDARHAFRRAHRETDLPCEICHAADDVVLVSYQHGGEPVLETPLVCDSCLRARERDLNTAAGRVVDRRRACGLGLAS